MQMGFHVLELQVHMGSTAVHPSGIIASVLFRATLRVCEVFELILRFASSEAQSMC